MANASRTSLPTISEASGVRPVWEEWARRHLGDDGPSANAEALSFALFANSLAAVRILQTYQSWIVSHATKITDEVDALSGEPVPSELNQRLAYNIGRLGRLSDCYDKLSETAEACAYKTGVEQRLAPTALANVAMLADRTVDMTSEGAEETILEFPGQVQTVLQTSISAQEGPQWMQSGESLLSQLDRLPRLHTLRDIPTKKLDRPWEVFSTDLGEAVHYTELLRSTPFDERDLLPPRSALCLSRAQEEVDLDVSLKEIEEDLAELDRAYLNLEKERSAQKWELNRPDSLCGASCCLERINRYRPNRQAQVTGPDTRSPRSSGHPDMDRATVTSDWPETPSFYWQLKL